MRIKDFQQLMMHLYGHNDLKRGADRTMLWLVEEIGELAEAVRKEDREAMEEEFADVLAWLASLANVLEVDLEMAARSKYDGRCPRCGKEPCICKNI